jgi:ribose-phosphate pyrophosphokinase
MTSARTPISARLVVDLLEASGVNRIITMDLHCPQIQGMTNLPFDHLMPTKVFMDAFGKERDNLMVFGPDVGSAKRAAAFAGLLGCDTGLVVKKRKSAEKVEVQGVIGDPKGKDVIIVDDMTESCGTLIAAAKVIKEHGGKTVNVMVTHGVFTMTALGRILDQERHKYIDSISCTNTTNCRMADEITACTELKINILDVSEIFAEAIKRTNKNESISVLFPFAGF